MLLHADMHVISILLPLSLVLIVLGGICGMASSLARSKLLMGTASYFLLCSKFQLFTSLHVLDRLMFFVIDLYLVQLLVFS